MNSPRHWQDATWPFTLDTRAQLGSVVPLAKNTAITTPSSRLVGLPLCPDLLDITMIGAADGWRGRAVRIFFRVLRLVSGT